MNLSSYQKSEFELKDGLADTTKTRINMPVEGILISIPLGKSIIEENNSFFSIIEIVKSEREYNIVFLEGSPLKDEVNSILEEMQTDGTYQEIYDKWFAIIK